MQLTKTLSQWNNDALLASIEANDLKKRVDVVASLDEQCLEEITEVITDYLCSENGAKFLEEVNSVIIDDHAHWKQIHRGMILNQIGLECSDKINEIVHDTTSLYGVKLKPIMFGMSCLTTEDMVSSETAVDIETITLSLEEFRGTVIDEISLMVILPPDLTKDRDRAKELTKSISAIEKALVGTSDNVLIDHNTLITIDI